MTQRKSPSSRRSSNSKVVDAQTTPVTPAAPEQPKVKWAVAIIVDENGNINFQDLQQQYNAAEATADAEFEQTIDVIHRRVEAQRLLSLIAPNIQAISRNELTNVLTNLNKITNPQQDANEQG